MFAGLMVSIALLVLFLGFAFLLAFFAGQFSSFRPHNPKNRYLQPDGSWRRK